jgi:NTE family protein
VSLALQGGGAHGAFTWGVLDLILEDGRLDIEAISGASAGAMNAVCLADGFREGGADGARKRLAAFWKAVSSEGSMSPGARGAFERMLAAWSLPMPAENPFLAFLGRYGSPYTFNPLNINPLEEFIARTIDFDRVRQCAQSAIKLFISATNVRTGKVRVFDGHELTARHIMASACLPKLFQAVDIDGETYWDGGYMGNPPLFPLFYGIDADDVMLVQINPLHRDDVPKTADEIDARLNEISFNGPLVAELRAVNFVARMIDEGHLPRDRFKRVRMHRIALQDAIDRLSSETKLSNDYEFLLKLHKAGRKAAERWLRRNHAALGKNDTLDLRQEFG